MESFQKFVMVSVYVRNGPGMSQMGKQSPLTNVAWVLFRPGVIAGSSLFPGFSCCTNSDGSSVFH